MPLPDTLAIWVGSVGTVGALSAAIVELRRGNRQRSDDYEAAQARLAGRVFAYAAQKVGGTSEDGGPAIFDAMLRLANHTDAPVFDVAVLVDDYFAFGRLVVPPGETAEIRLSEMERNNPGNKELLAKTALLKSVDTRTRKPTVSVEFTNIENQRWCTSTRSGSRRVPHRSLSDFTTAGQRVDVYANMVSGPAQTANAASTSPPSAQPETSGHA